MSKERYNPYPGKRHGRRTVVGLAYHKTEIGLKDQKIEKLKREIKAQKSISQINEQAIKSAESQLEKNWKELRRLNMIIDKLVGYES